MSAILAILTLTVWPVQMHGVDPQRLPAATATFTRAFTSPSALTQAVDALVEWYANQGLPMAHVWKIERHDGAIVLYVSEGPITAIRWEGVSDDTAQWLERQINIPLLGLPYDDVRITRATERLSKIPWIAKIEAQPEVRQRPNAPAEIALVFNVVPKPPQLGAAFVVDTRGAGIASDLIWHGFPSPSASFALRPALRLWRIALAPNDSAPAYVLSVSESLGKPTGIRPIHPVGVHLTSEVQRAWNLPWRELGIRFDQSAFFIGPSAAVHRTRLAFGWEAEDLTHVRQIVESACDARVCPTGQSKTRNVAAILHLGDPTPNQTDIVGGIPRRNAARITVRGVTGTRERYGRVEGVWTQRWEIHPGHWIGLHTQGGGLFGQAQFYRRFTLGGLDTLAAFPEQHRFGSRYAQFATRIEPDTGSQAVYVWAGIEGGTAWERNQLNPALLQTSAGVSIDLVFLRAWLQLATPLRGQGGRSALVFRLIVEQ